MNVSVSGTIDQKTYLKKFRWGFTPLAPPQDSPMIMCSILLFQQSSSFCHQILCKIVIKIN